MWSNEYRDEATEYAALADQWQQGVRYVVEREYGLWLSVARLVPSAHREAPICSNLAGNYLQ